MLGHETYLSIFKALISYRECSLITRRLNEKSIKARYQRNPEMLKIEQYSKQSMDKRIPLDN